MSFFQSLLFGIVQGATEFLPVSSSGHLALMKELFGLGDVPLLFDVLLHVATLIVVAVVFRDRIGRIFASLYRGLVRRLRDDDRENLRLALALAIATVVTGVIGVLLGRLNVGQNPRLVSSLFVVTGAVLVVSRFVGGARDYGDIGIREGVIVGVGQGLGVLPGISRSGISITSALLSGMGRQKAGEFAFLVSIPAIVGALVLTLRDAGELSQAVGVGQLVAAFASALVVGFAALRLLIRLIGKGRLYLFSVYLIPVGIIGLFLL